MTLNDDPVGKPLLGKRIAIPESRELVVFANMLEERGAEVLRCPLVAIHDAPDKALIEQWLRDFSRGDFDDLILLTGEGLRRLLGFAERAGGTLQEDFIAALGTVRKITRGPKPGNALRRVGLKPDLLAVTPTTEGVIDSLRGESLQGRRIAVQLYGTEPNLPLISFLEGQGAFVSVVSPYVYADQAEDAQVEALVDRLIGGTPIGRTLDAMAFTSSPQVRRLFQIAGKTGREVQLRESLNSIVVAAVGPVVADSLREQGVEVKIMPETSFFMKPLVRQLVRAFSA